MLKTRLITAGIAVALLTIVLITDKIWLTIGVVLVAIVGVCELYAAAGLIKNKFLCTLGLIGSVLVCLGDMLDPHYVMSLVFIYFLLIFIAMLYNHKEITLENVALILFGNVYVAYFLTHIVLIRRLEGSGQYLVWLVFLGACAADTFAYFVGRAFGKHKMAPEISPHKTTEGAVGGIIGTGFSFLLFGAILAKYFNLHLDMTRLFILGILCAVVGEIGDLAASAIKRHYNIKDFGYIFPGHGGVLDRFDSILLVAPAVYLFINNVGLM